MLFSASFPSRFSTPPPSYIIAYYEKLQGFMLYNFKTMKTLEELVEQRIIQSMVAAQQLEPPLKHLHLTLIHFPLLFPPIMNTLKDVLNTT